MTYRTVHLINATFQDAHFDRVQSRAERGVAIAWNTNVDIRTAHGAAAAYAAALAPEDRAYLHTVCVYDGRVTIDPVSPVMASRTMRGDGRVLEAPDGTRARFSYDDPASFHWVANSEDGCEGATIRAPVPDSAAANGNAALAWIVLETARIHNASYVAGESEPDRPRFGRHTITLDDAARRVARDDTEAALVSCMLFGMWNDACDWALATLERRGPHPGDARSAQYDAVA